MRRTVIAINRQVSVRAGPIRHPTDRPNGPGTIEQPPKEHDMPAILHRISIDADPTSVRDQIATKEGIARWWTATPLGGDATPGGRLEVLFPGNGQPSAIMEIIEDDEGAVVWRCVEGPSDWVDTTISFTFVPHGDATTLLFRHAGWRKENEFMAGCSTNWGAYLTGLKSGVEHRGFGAYPAGEISRWS
jgi:uncharacterized protein YndB with AHSA1/START domain